MYMSDGAHKVKIDIEKNYGVKCRPYRIIFTFHENLSDEKLPEMKRTFLFVGNLKLLVTCSKTNHKFA